MTKKYYLAYGSNCNLDQMARRCPAAEVAGPVTLRDYRLTFNSRSRAGGVANIRRRKGSEVSGLLWMITADCERSLDRYEGYPILYDKKTVTVETEEGEKIKALAYVMTKGHNSPSIPTQSYFDGIVDGFIQNGMDPDPVYRALEATRDQVNAMGETREGDA